jgi:hypothetical protein
VRVVEGVAAVAATSTNGIGWVGSLPICVVAVVTALASPSPVVTVPGMILITRARDAHKPLPGDPRAAEFSDDLSDEEGETVLQPKMLSEGDGDGGAPGVGIMQVTRTAG